MTDLFDDIFHARGDDEDANEDEIIDFDDIIINVIEKQSEIQVAHIMDDDINEKLTSKESKESKQSDEEITIVSTKNMATDNKTKDQIKMPFYLSAKNKVFDQTMSVLLQQTASSINIDELRHIAYLKHNLRLNNLSKLQWQTYLLSVTGQINIPQQQRAINKPLIWPSEINLMIVKKKFNNIRNESEITHTVCRNFVQEHLRQLREEADELQLKFNSQKRRLNDFSDELNKAIEEFIYIRYINQYELIIQKKIVTTEYDFYDRCIELEYLELKPNTYQVRSRWYYFIFIYFLFLFLILSSYVYFKIFAKINLNKKKQNMMSIY
jgi:hypothetical protein